MREIKFRGKRRDNGEWIYGSLHHFKVTVGNTEVFTIIVGAEHTPETGVIFGKRHELITETVGQFTGLKNKSGKEIYEGDIIKVPYYSTDFRIEEVKIVDCECSPFNSYACSEDGYGEADKSEIIGNVFDNPELIEK